MTEPRVFQLGIVGGCMTHQPGIPMNDLYHRQLAAMVEASTGIRIRPRIARAFGFDYAIRLNSLSSRYQLDGVLLHLRVVIMRRSRLVVSLGGDGHQRRSLHPALFNRSHDGEAVAALRAVETAGVANLVRGPDDLAEVATRHDRTLPGKRFVGLRVRDLNWAAGALVGLDRWAVEDEIRMLEDFVRACAERSLPLFVLGPTPLLGRQWQARAPRMLTGRLGEFADDNGLPVALIEDTHDSAGRPLVKSDGMHLTLEGHHYIATLLYERGMPEWIVSAGRPTEVSPLPAQPHVR